MVKRIVVLVSGVIVALSGILALQAPAAPNASAAPRCADVHVLFARGTAETAPPLGVTGIAFENSLRNRIKGDSVRVEPVNYPASSNFSNKLEFAETFVTGVKHAQKRVRQIAAACPKTDIVVGGYSQGGALAAYTVADSYDIPASYADYRQYAPKPMSAELADHVAAVVLFAPPSARFLKDAGAPTMRVGKAYAGKTIRFCTQGDTICNGAPLAGPNALHLLYPVNGSTDRAAAYVARRV
ncbi:cutinase family protein [Gordonia liuliyuniae]|uniref:Cutinase n=1 Tax=Gordonia liuliyuniae TaxID=2911517 RepID=A0ABS9INY8_9ACTN|nr:cutinase family protein [Gordonia liuliyuniae]MCF8587254.1 cutinase family protein [Gordonia liuliyuniae]